MNQKDKLLYIKNIKVQLFFTEKKKILIAAAKKRCDTIIPIPYMKDKKVCVNDVFVEVGADIYVTKPLVKKGGKWKRLSSYSNIFNDDRTKFKRRIITADPGCGKSTMTLQLAYDWCNGVKGSAFENVELLILLQLRQLGGLKSIYSAIKMILVPGDRRIKSSDIKSIIESCSSVEVLLDGYDEYPSMHTNNVSFVDRIIRSEMFENINVTLTSRYRPKEYDKLNTKLVRLVGLDNKARDQYIRKVFNGSGEENVATIKQALANNPILDDLCQIPLFLGMFSHMIHDGHDLQQFRSVTNLFRYTIKCFHSHRRNKSLDKNTVEYFTQYETQHSELNELALEGLTKEIQQLSWRKDELYRRIGRECCDHYLSVGVFVQDKEFDVINDTESGHEGLNTMDVVRYYRKIFCEYYAAHGVVDLYISGGNDRLQEICNKMDPFDIQYVYRISCGIDPAVGKEIISFLKSRKDCDKLVTMCIMERAGDVTEIKNIVQQLCSNAVYLTSGDSRLLQRSIINVLEIASEHEVSISLSAPPL